MACHRWFFTAFILCTILSGRAFATISYISAAGFSGQTIVQSTVVTVPSPAPSASPGAAVGVTAFPSFFFSNISTTQDGGTPPNYIDGGGAGCPNVINENCHNASDSFSITATSSAAITASPNYFYFVYPGTTTALTGSISAFKQIGNSPQAYVPGQAITFTATWGAICTAINAANPTLGIGNNCNDTATPRGAHSATFYLIADPTGTQQVGSEVASFTITFISSIPVNSSISGQIGLYGFTAFPGDQKVYLQDIAADTSFNTTSENGVGVNNVQVYYTGVPLVNGSYDPTTQFVASNFTILGPTTATAATGTFNLSIDSLGNLQSNEVTGLTDGLMYYFHVAIVDNAGNIGYLTNTTDDTVTHTAIPDVVVGLLSSDHCFIATAAFGSPLAEEVKILREFRNKFLLTSQWGKKFVHWYYKNSPPWAAKLARHESWRTVVRAGLYPLIAYAFIALKIGAFNGALALATLLMLPLLIIKWKKTANPWQADP